MVTECYLGYLQSVTVVTWSVIYILPEGETLWPEAATLGPGMCWLGVTCFFSFVRLFWNQILTCKVFMLVREVPKNFLWLHGITRICASLGLRMKCKTLFMSEEEKHGHQAKSSIFSGSWSKTQNGDQNRIYPLSFSACKKFFKMFKTIFFLNVPT